LRFRRALPVVPAAAVALLLATAAPAGATVNGAATFSETGSPQSFTVPSNVVGVTVDLAGAGGGAEYNSEDETQVAGGRGGLTVAAIATTPGSTLDVVVGSAGTDGSEEDSTGYTVAGGYNGGGEGYGTEYEETDWFASGGGGGATELFVGSSSTPALVAGGGGGAGVSTGDGEAGASGGNGGGATGASSYDGCASGGVEGTLSGPGAAGSDDTGGTCTDVTYATMGDAGAATGPDGGDGAQPFLGGGGGGGGGYFGGGGGSVSDNADGSGGGGGSSYAGSGPGGTELGAGAAGSTDGSAGIYWVTASTVTPGTDTFTAVVPDDVGASPTETFTVGSTTLCGDVPVVDGTASCTASNLPVGSDDVTATLSTVFASSLNVPGSVTLDAANVGGGAGNARLDAQGDPWDGTTEVFAVTVAGVPVPESGAGVPAGVPPLAAFLILVGAGGILATRRQRRAS
jgi:hypothetical protein